MTRCVTEARERGECELSSAGEERNLADIEERNLADMSS